MATRLKRQFTLAPQEDIVTPLGADQLTLNVRDTCHGLVAYAIPFSNSTISEAAWKGVLSERRKWEEIIREALIKADDAGVKRIEVSISRTPPWFEIMLERMKFRLGESWAKTAYVMVANLK